MYLAALARHLDAAGLVVYGRTGADCFLETLPASPVAAVGLFSVPRAGDDLSPWGEVSAQLVVRADTDSARTGHERAATLRAALHGLRHVTLAPATPDELRLVWCVAQSRFPVSLGRDPEQRVKWSVRLDLMVTAPSTHTIV